ncbi:MAG: alpha/beta hydrolase [Acidimicrobiales bacterium]|nr:alpha/beta hydrolase [Acidimicrobiales bacterium]
MDDGRRAGVALYGDPDGAPVFMFHGTPASRITFSFLHDRAAERGVCIVAPDRPGIGLSDDLPNRGILDYPDDVAAIADALGHATFAVAGWSLGSAYALACADRLGERVSSVAVISGMGPLDAEGSLEGFGRTEREALRLTHVAPWLMKPFYRALCTAVRTRPDLALRAIRHSLGTGDRDQLGDDDPRKLTDAELADDISTRIADDQRRKQGLTLSSLASFAPEIIEAAQADGLLEFGDWNLLSSAEAGEAQAVADVALRGEDGPFAADDVYVLLDAYQQGGKRGRSGDSHWDAVTYKVRTTLQFWNPTNYSVVQVQKALDKEAVPGEPPPFAEADPDAPVVSVVLVKDLGDKRVPPAMISIGSLLVFLVLCWMLHLRDKQVAERLAQK